MDANVFTTAPWEAIGNIEQFLGLPEVFGDEKRYYLNTERNFYCLHDIGCLTLEKGRPHPNITEENERDLRRFFAPYNQRLYELVGYDFGWPSE